MGVFRRFVETQEVLDFRRHLQDAAKPDIASLSHEFLSWRGAGQVMQRAGVDPDEFEASMQDFDDDFYAMAEKIANAMSQRDADSFHGHVSNMSPGEMPSNALMDLQTHMGRRGFMPPGEWLIHFSDDAEEIWRTGFRFGQPSMDRLALTSYQHKSQKAGGGYDFAFVAQSRHAIAAANKVRYGRDAVMFKAAGIPVYHSSDEETQIVFWGPSVPAADTVLLSREDGEWAVVPRRGGRGHLFRGDFQRCVAWVVANHRQYRSVL